jgi:DNA-binding XRE family transcriptional regulator
MEANSTKSRTCEALYGTLLVPPTLSAAAAARHAVHLLSWLAPLGASGEAHQAYLPHGAQHVPWGMVLSLARRDRAEVPDRSGELDPRLRRFGSHLRQLREQRGLTIEELAERAQIGARHVARVEAGRGSPSLLWLYAVAEGLNVHPSELLRGEAG